METNKFKPFIAHNKDYIEKVANSIKSKPPLEEIEFNRLTDVLKQLGIIESPYLFENTGTFNSDKIQDILHRGFEAIHASQILGDLRKKLEDMYAYLAPEDPLEKSDLIFVFGSAEENCARVAAQLYNNGMAPLIMFTGKTAAYLEKTGSSEAEHFAKIAHESGIPREAMILETESINSPENVLNGVRLMKERGLQPERIILITFDRHMRRAALTFRGVLDWPAKLIRHPAKSKSSKEDYFQSEKYWTYVCFEYIKLYGARLMKHF